jgi:hypothetical protein
MTPAKDLSETTEEAQPGLKIQNHAPQGSLPRKQPWPAKPRT